MLFLAHREELIDQAREKIGLHTGELPDVEMGQRYATLDSGLVADSRVVVGSVQTLVKPKRRARFKPEDFGLVVIDEAHHATAGAWASVVAQYPDARVLGVTATPERLDGRGMVCDPGLALAIARHDAGLSEGDEGRAVPWPVIAGLLQLFWVGVSQRVASRHRSGRLKQWLNYLRKVYPEAQQAFDELRLIHDPALMAQWLARQEVMASAV